MKHGIKYGLTIWIALTSLCHIAAQEVDSIALNALSLDGVSTYGHTNNSGLMETRFTTGFAIEAWFKTGVPANTMTITAKTNELKQDYHFLLGLKNGVLRFVRGNTELLGVSTIEANIWNHISATYDGGGMRLYLNGQLESVVANGQLLAEGYNLVELGSKPIPSGRTEYWNGSLEELKFWGEARSAGDVLLGKHQISLESGGLPKAYYQMNEFVGAQSNEFRDVYGEKEFYVTNGNLVASDCPVAISHGYHALQTTANTQFYGTDVAIRFGLSTNLPIAVNAMINAPNSWAGIDNHNQVMDGRYWLIDWVGSPVDPQITFTAQAPLPTLLELLPENASLYRRDLGSSGSWSMVSTATAIDLVSNTIKFDITEIGEYAVVIDDDDSNITTQLRNGDCGRPATTFSNTLTANPLNNPDLYEFVVYNVADGFYDTLITSERNFKLKHLEHQVRYGRTYTVKVRGIWSGQPGPYGNECDVTTIPFPTTDLQPQFWGATVNMKQRIKCNSIAGVEKYIFNVSNAILGYEEEFVSDVPNFKLKYMQGPLNYQDAYDIKVRCVMMGDTSAYGIRKTVFTDVRQTNRLRDGYCDTTDIRKSTYLKAETVHFVDEYQFRVINTLHGVNGTYTTSDKRFRLREIPGTSNCGITYAINVRTIMNGDTTAWGDTCFVTTENLGCRLASPDMGDDGIGEISSAEASEDQDGPMILGAFPNPFNHSVQLNFQTEETQNVSIEIYDAFGRMLRQYPPVKTEPGVHDLTWDGRNDRGNDCPNGTYIMVLRNDRNFLVESVRLVLRR